MASERGRDPVDEREEAFRYIDDQPSERPLPTFSEGLGRIPTGPARGSRLRAKKAKSCEVCEGDLWIENEAGEIEACVCRKKNAARRAQNRLLAGGWWKGTSLSFAAPPLTLVPAETQTAVERLCAKVKAGEESDGLWLVGGPGAGKSALSAYIAQRLYPSDDAIAGQIGDLLGHLRWLGAVKGELAVERRLQKLIETPLLVLDNVDRAVRSFPSSAPFGFEASCVSQDLIRLAWLLQERHAAMKPTVVTSRVEPSECHLELASVARADLVKGLLGTAVGASDPFEDFPEYTNSMLKRAMESVRDAADLYYLDPVESIALAA